MMATAEDVHSKLRQVWGPEPHSLSDFESARAAQRGAYEERAQLIGEIQNNQRKRVRECLSKVPVRQPEAECSKTSPQSALASHEGGMFKRPITPLHSPSRHKYLKSPPQHIGHPMKCVNGAPQAYPNGVHPQHMPGAMNGIPMPQMNGQMRAGNQFPPYALTPALAMQLQQQHQQQQQQQRAAYYNNAAVPLMMQNKPYAPPPNHPMHYRQGAQFHPNQQMDYATAMQMPQLRLQGMMTPQQLAQNAQFQQAAQQHSAQSQVQHQLAQQQHAQMAQQMAAQQQMNLQLQQQQQQQQQWNNAAYYSPPSYANSTPHQPMQQAAGTPTNGDAAAAYVSPLSTPQGAPQIGHQASPQVPHQPSPQLPNQEPAFGVKDVDGEEDGLDDVNNIQSTLDDPVGNLNDYMVVFEEQEQRRVDMLTG